MTADWTAESMVKAATAVLRIEAMENFILRSETRNAMVFLIGACNGDDRRTARVFV